MYDLEIADRLRAEGLEVVECDGWQTRGSGELYPQGFVFHHTADGPSGATPSLNGVIYGFSGSAPGPLANVLQSREPGYRDKFYVVAAGRANHAGTGGWNGLEGNASVHGLEIEHTGTEHFPEERALLATRAAAALGRGRYDQRYCCQHFEWSNWGDGSKIDVAQDVDANHWRDLVRNALAGTTPHPPTEEEDDMKATFVHAQGTDYPYAMMAGMFRWGKSLTPRAINGYVDKELVTNKRDKNGNVVYVELTSDEWVALIDLDVVMPKLLAL